MLKDAREMYQAGQSRVSISAHFGVYQGALTEAFKTNLDLDNVKPKFVSKETPGTVATLVRAFDEGLQNKTGITPKDQTILTRNIVKEISSLKGFIRKNKQKFINNKEYKRIYPKAILIIEVIKALE